MSEKNVCERLSVTKLCVEELCVCDKAVRERWCVCV